MSLFDKIAFTTYLVFGLAILVANIYNRTGRQQPEWTMVAIVIGLLVVPVMVIAQILIWIWG